MVHAPAVAREMFRVVIIMQQFNAATGLDRKSIGESETQSNPTDADAVAVSGYSTTKKSG